MIRIVLTITLSASMCFPASAQQKRQWRVEKVWNAEENTTTSLSADAVARTSGSLSIFGKVTIHTGCNTVTARGFMTGNKIKFGKPSTTKKMCEDETRFIEAGLMQGITLARFYEEARRRIILRDQNGKEVLTLVKQ